MTKLVRVEQHFPYRGQQAFVSYLEKDLMRRQQSL